MNLRGISYYLSLSCYPVTLLSFFNILYSSYFNHYLNLDSYILTLVTSLLLGVGLYLFSKNSEKNINAYFEAVSGLTTTGFTVFYNVKFLDPTLIIWRSSSHWIGGLFFLIFLILIFSNFKNEYKLTHLVHNPDKATNLFKDTNKIIIKIFFIYTFFTSLIFIFFTLSGIRLFNSFNLAMSVSSTGAFLPTNELSEIIKYSLQKIILIIAVTFSALNIYFFFSIFNNAKVNKKHQEDLLILLAIVFFSLILFFSIKEISFLNIFFNVVSSLSNSGLALEKPPGNFYLFFIFITIIGGSIISNSSGIKLLRLYILFKSTVLEIFKLVSPNVIIDQRILKTEHKIDNKNLNSSFFIFICFFISIFILSSILTAGGLNFENSFKLSILTITNTVNSSLFGLKDIDFFNLLTSSKIFIILFMVIGKIELISLFLIIKKIISRN